MKSTTSKLKLICAFPMRAMFAVLTAIFVLAIGARADGPDQNVYNYTGGVQTFTVPAGVTIISVDAFGAAGTYDAIHGNHGGKGGRVQAILTVVPGDELLLYVGQSLVYDPDYPIGYSKNPNWNGGGIGNWNTGSAVGANTGWYSNVGGGGGATDIRIGGALLTNRVLVAGGGGGGEQTNGGAGGGLIGGAGASQSATVGGGGGTQSQGGSGGGDPDFPARYGKAGNLGVGGQAGGSDTEEYGGSGGGGYYGGGGGGSGGSWSGSGGGGGSSYTDPRISFSVVHTQGLRTGHGELIISFTAVPVITVLSGTDTVEQGSTWTDAGATADGGEAVTISGSVTINTPPGVYTITYAATDAAGNTGTATRTVTVVDTTAPVITVTSGTDTVERGGSWTDAGATADGGETVIASGNVDANTVGSYPITYTATDAAGNVGTATRTVTVVDTTAPVITVAVAANRLADLVGGSLTDDGNGNYTLVSNIDLTEDLIIESNETLFINTNIQLNISAKVHNKGIVFLTGNTNNQTTVNNYGVFVNEGLIKSSNQYEYFYNKSGGEFYNLNLNQGDAITQKLYHFSSRSGSVIFDVKSTFNFGRLNTISGDYTGDYTGEIPYEVALLDGNKIEQGATWADPGATADTGETVTPSGTVDTSVVGTYTITYTATDAAGNAGTVTRTVTVVDITAPVITVTSGTDTVEPGVTWADAGATADTGEVVSASGTVDTSTSGTYTITYTATDAAGNVGTATRTITVGDGNFAPVGVDASVERSKGLVASGKTLVLDMEIGFRPVKATITLPDESEWRDGDMINLNMSLNRENFKLSSPQFSPELVDYLENQLDVFGDFTMRGMSFFGDYEVRISDLERFDLSIYGDLNLSIYSSGGGGYIDYPDPELESLFEASGFNTDDSNVSVDNLVRLEDVTSSITSGSLAATDVDQNSVLAFTLDAPVAGLTLATNGNYTFDGNNQAYADLWQGDSREVVADWTVTDQHGATDSRKLTITVNGTGVNPDTTAPVIAVTPGTDTVEQGATWTDAGATADGGETVTASGTVDTNTVGTYTITYTATDAAGNTGTATRTVTVLEPDTTAPVISVASGTDTVGQGATWTDAGATADTGEIVTASGTVDTNIVGTYAITYTATDAAGNAGTATRTVTVVTNLTFTLNGSGTEYIVSDCLTSASGSLGIPSTYNGLPVTSIGSDAFSDCSALVSITIPDSVTSIPLTAFENSGLTSLSFSSPLLEAAEAERDAKLTLDQVSDLRAGSTMIEIEDGKATLSMEVEQSDDLGIWTTGGSSTLQITIDAAAGNKFFRFKMRE